MVSLNWEGHKGYGNRHIRQTPGQYKKENDSGVQKGSGKKTGRDGIHSG